MNVDTGEFAAISAALAQLTPAAQAVAALGDQVARLTAQAAEAEAAVRRTSPRHARPRRERPAYLRAVGGAQ